MINLVIPAAGAATRLRPLSAYTSKAMVRVNGKPCIDYILEQAHKLANIAEVVVVDGKFDDIREYCNIKHPEVKFAKQESLDGPKDAIRIGMSALSDMSLPVVVWLGDAIILEDKLPLGENFLLCKEVNDHHNWCMWDSKQFYDKPTTHISDGVALVGLYSFANGCDAIRSFTDDANEYNISVALTNYGVTRFKKYITNKWYDIGDLPTYHKTCAELLNLKARAFHNIKHNPELGTIQKEPDFHDPASIKRIDHEKTWYDWLPRDQQMFVPRILSHPTDLIMSYESGTLLSDMMLYEDLPESTWEYLIDKVFKLKLNYFNKTSKIIEFIENFSHLSYEMWVQKTHDRLKLSHWKLCGERHEFYTQKQKEWFEKTAAKCQRLTRPIECMHGDLHFGNILYDQTTDRIKLIDPRGQYGNDDWVGIFGDDMYDWCKLSHDLYHGYNALVANVPHNETVKRVFVKLLHKYELPVQEIIDGGLLLLATCIPLHNDDWDRQIRFRDYITSRVSIHGGDKNNCI